MAGSSPGALEGESRTKNLQIQESKGIWHPCVWRRRACSTGQNIPRDSSPIDTLTDEELKALAEFETPRVLTCQFIDRAVQGAAIDAIHDIKPSRSKAYNRRAKQQEVGGRGVTARA